MDILNLEELKKKLNKYKILRELKDPLDIKKIAYKLGFKINMSSPNDMGDSIMVTSQFERGLVNIDVRKRAFILDGLIEFIVIEMLRYEIIKLEYLEFVGSLNGFTYEKVIMDDSEDEFSIETEQLDNVCSVLGFYFLVDPKEFRKVYYEIINSKNFLIENLVYELADHFALEEECVEFLIDEYVARYKNEVIRFRAK